MKKILGLLGVGNRGRFCPQVLVQKLGPLGLALGLVVSVPALLAVSDKQDEQTTVYYAEGKNRVHLADCKRLANKEGMKKMTLAEAKAKGLELCSRCPGSKTPGKGQEKNDSWVKKPIEISEMKQEEFKPSPRSPLVKTNPEGKLSYQSYSDKGDRILDFSHCGYRKSEVPLPTIPVVKTLSPPRGETIASEKMAYPQGTDSRALIQKALDEVAAMKPNADGFKGAVLLKKGTWYLKDGLLVDSGVVLRGEGEGPDGTVLIITPTKPNGVGIQIGKSAEGGTQVTSLVPVTGVLSSEKIDDKRMGFILTLKDGYRFGVRNPGSKARFKNEDFVGQEVTIMFQAITTTQGNETRMTLKHTKPIEIKKANNPPPLNPELILPGKEKKAEEALPPVKITDSYLPSGSTVLNVKDASGFKVGDRIKVIKSTNAKWIAKLGVGERLRHIRGGKEGKNKKPWGPQTFGHHRRITTINGNSLTLDVMLPQSIEAQFGGGSVQKISDDDSASRCGAESLRIVSNYDRTITRKGKGTNFRNLKDGFKVSARDAWVKKCTVLHTWFSAVHGTGAQDSTVRDCQSLKPVGPIAGGHRYSFVLGGSTGLLYFNCYAEDGRHDFAVGARTMGPNAFVNCSTLRGGQSEPHARWGVGTLYDSITMKEGGSIAAINRGDSGTGHGWAAANTVIWNCSAPVIVVSDPETEGENNFAIGYTGPTLEKYNIQGLWYANTRAGYWGTPKEGKYFGFALMGDGHIESPSQPAEPRSLFIQQLIDRLGEEKANTILK